MQMRVAECGHRVLFVQEAPPEGIVVRHALRVLHGRRAIDAPTMRMRHQWTKTYAQKRRSPVSTDSCRVAAEHDDDRTARAVRRVQPVVVQAATS
jgi:hypothetical protein